MDQHDDIRRHVRTYIAVFAALMVLTAVTVGVSTLDLGVAGGIAVALVVATIKAGLVAAYFMHLISERKVIYASLILTAVFFAVLMWLPIFTAADPIIYRNVP